VEFDVRTKSGQLRHILWSAEEVDVGGERCVLGSAMDITERKRAERLLRESEAKFSQLAEAMPQIVWITRPDGWNIYFNQQWMTYTGLALEQSLGHGWNQPFHPDDQQRAWDAWQHATATLASKTTPGYPVRWRCCP
jgi:PAS domain-containing protein